MSEGVNLKNMTVIRVVLTVDYLVDTNIIDVTEFETWVTDFPLCRSHVARDYHELSNKKYVSHQVLSVEEAFGEGVPDEH